MKFVELWKTRSDLQDKICTKPEENRGEKVSCDIIREKVSQDPVLKSYAPLLRLPGIATAKSYSPAISKDTKQHLMFCFWNSTDSLPFLTTIKCWLQILLWTEQPPMKIATKPGRWPLEAACIGSIRFFSFLRELLRLAFLSTKFAQVNWQNC